MKIKIRSIAFFIAMSMSLSSFSILSVNALYEPKNVSVECNAENGINANEKSNEVAVDFTISEENIYIGALADENEIIVGADENMELQPMIAMSCEGPGTVYSSGNYAGYRYSYNSNAAQPYNLGHPDGRSLGIGDYALFDLCNDYQSTIEAMLHAEENAEALTEILGCVVTVGMVLAKNGMDQIAIKLLGESTFRSMLIDVLSSETDIESEIRNQIIEILMPSFVDIQHLMNEADNIFDDLYDICSN